MLINPLDKDDLSNSIIKMINDTDIRNHYGLLGYNQSKNFSLDKTATDTINAYNFFFNN